MFDMINIEKEPKSIFLRIFGTSPLMKIFDFLIVNEEFDYSMADIARLSGVGYATLKLIWPKLEKNEIIKQTRMVGKAKMYQLNLENPIIKRFKIFYWDITKTVTMKDMNNKQLVKLSYIYKSLSTPDKIKIIMLSNEKGYTITHFQGN